MDVATLQTEFDRIAAEYVRRFALRVESVGADGVALVLPVTPELVHGGGVLCGQAVLAAADTAMLVALIARLGGFRPMTTVQLQASFLRPVPGDAGTVGVGARVLRVGKSLCYGEVSFTAPGGALVAHATTTYALI